MVPRINRISPFAGVLSAVLAFIAPGVARADFEITFSEPGYLGGSTNFAATIPPNPAPSFTFLTFNGTYGDFSITFDAKATNGSNKSFLLSDTLQVQNTDLTAMHTLTFAITETDFSLPGTAGSPLAMTSHIGGTVINGGSGQALTFQSYADNLNLDFGKSGTTTLAQTPDVTGGVSNSFKDDAGPVTFLRTSGLYSVSVFNTMMLAPGGMLNYSTNTQLAATPAPAGLLLILTGLPALGFGGWLRRRNNKVSV